MAAQPLGVDRRVEREAVLGRPVGAEEVGSRPRRHHEEVPGQLGPVGETNGLTVGVERDDLALVHGDLGQVPEDRPQRPGDVLDRQLRGRDLVEQRLELVVVVAVDQVDVDVRLGQRVRARHPGDPGPGNDDAGHCDFPCCMANIKLGGCAARAWFRSLSDPNGPQIVGVQM